MLLPFFCFRLLSAQCAVALLVLAVSLMPAGTVRSAPVDLPHDGAAIAARNSSSFLHNRRSKEDNLETSSARRAQAAGLAQFDNFPEPRSVPACGSFCRQSGLVLEKDTWRQLPSSWGPPTISREEDVDAIGTYVAPILYGGLGNILFQLAALHAYGRKHNVPVVVGYFQHWNRAFHTFEPWGGHTPPATGVTLKHTFPALQWCSVEVAVPPVRVFNRYAFKIEVPDEYAPLPNPKLLPAYIHGYFFNHAYWHPSREHVLRVLRFNPGVEEYVSLKYGDLLAGTPDAGTITRSDQTRAPARPNAYTGGKGALQTVSLHLRLGYAQEPAKKLLEGRRLPPTSFYERVFTREFDADRTLYLVFSDNNVKAQAMMDEFARSVPGGLQFVVVEEDVVHSVAMMARCQHHVLTSSTLSFWGAYLDVNQPHGGRTLLHSTFFIDHGRGMLPPDFGWEVIE
ncbi:hypothetical protein PTSG_06316 [Salpingoeca rosetta]|uniref:L-Fucosyltransferase n=1 Tax=Salpingoeca rosetta (strain ATCC 50818 / BSB-021) TaxID=946362 RepID=F2UCK0_SALR5|nr:uncharacterized protein PTSG_06316 [Salpingoeca rosetta]EGD74307.1 hypothetical protein PTSG_06316 [Salpingoeca rosetta]|eukprot:XP_004993207.1 hypothetical protein PTSG_06316 [Salpingoeca rosetta]